MFACKCLNYDASSGSCLEIFGAGGPGNAHSNNNNNNINNRVECEDAKLLAKKFAQGLRGNFQFYDSFIDFFKHAHGPIRDLIINNVHQKALIYSLTIEVPEDQSRWQLCLCINCKQVLFARRFNAACGAGAGATPTDYLINLKLWTSESELKQRRNNKSFSEAYNVLILDQDDTAPVALAAGATNAAGGEPTSASMGIANSASNLSIGSLSTQAPIDGRLQRVRQLENWQQLCLQAEINATNERLENYTAQQYALLKSYEEKCNQEGAFLQRLIKQVPEQVFEVLDHGLPVALEVTGGGVGAGGAGPGARRRNTISSRRDLGVPTTPTNPLAQPPSFLGLTQEPLQQQQHQHQPQQPLPSATILSARKMSNFDTPPATPEATPMSVGNSPTFRQQQQQQQQQQQASGLGSNTLLLSTPAAGSSGTDDTDDCLFDLESDVYEPSHASPLYHQQQEQHYQRQQEQQQQRALHQHETNMSDADEAEDALDLDSSLPIAMRGGGRGASLQLPYANFARSLPVEISNSPLAERANNNNQHVLIEDEEGLDNTVDIAASIQALAKSVHGEAVFGDLPRPRLRSQI